MRKCVIYLNLDEQIHKLEDDKKMIFSDNYSKEMFKNYLKWYGYNLVIKSLSHPLMYIPSENAKIYRPEFTSDNLRYLIDIDKNISIIFWKYFRVIEMFLNSTIVSVLYKIIDKKTSSPFISKLKEWDMNDIFSLVRKYDPTNLNKQKTYGDFFKSMIKFYKHSTWLLDRAKYNEKTLDVETKKHVDNFFVFNDIKKEDSETSKWQYLEIFNLASAWTFSFCVECFNAFTTTNQNKIIHDFFKDCNLTNKKLRLSANDFSILLELFSNFRNKLAHNEVILNFQCSYNHNDLSKIFAFFEINPLDCKSINLNEMLLIFEKIIGKNSVPQKGHTIAKESIKGEISKSIYDKLMKRTKRGYISSLLFEIIEDFSKIKFDEEIKNISLYNE